MRIVYDASTKSIISSPLVNECLETEQLLQNLLWNILIWNHFSPVALCGDIKQVFLQVHIKEEDRDATRFHWLIDKDLNQIEIYIDLPEHCLGSPFILRGTLTVHLGGCKEVDEILKSLYVDAVISDRNSILEVKQLKPTTIRIFRSMLMSMSA